MLIDTTEKLYTREAAEKFVEEMKVIDPEWRYVAVHNPKGTGYSFVEIYDEEGEYVGKSTLGFSK